ncbi:MAG: MFS transporter [Patescibacteria group bacterium]|nr:MFS transporter [Patescibacteria group bacterium]
MGNIFILGLVSLLTDVSTAMVSPLLPLFLISTLGATPLALGTIEGIAESASSVFKVIFGFASDRIRNRKGFATLGYGISALGKLLLAVSGGWMAVLNARLTDRFGKVVRTAPRDALIVESTGAEKKGAAFGLQRAMDASGSVLGAGIAFLVILRAPDQVQRVFWWAILPAAISVVVMLLFVRDPKRAPRPAGNTAAPLRFKWSAFPPKLKRFYGISALFALGNASSLFLLLKSQAAGFTATSMILLYLVFNLVHALTIYPVTKLSDRFGRRNLLVAGYLLFGLVYLGFAALSLPAWYWLLFAGYGLYLGATEGVEKALVADVAPPELKATALGLHATIVGIMVLPASLLAGTVWQIMGASAPFSFSAITGFSATMLALIYLR